MKWLQPFRKLLITPAQEEPLSALELEHFLHKQIGQGSVSGVRRTLKKIGRQLSKKERGDLIDSCKGKKMFAEAFYLTRGLPPDAEKKSLLGEISREAAFADDYSTARAAALLSEKIIV